MNEPQASISHPSHDEFAALLEESLTTTALQEGNVVKGTIVGIEKDVAVIRLLAAAESILIEAGVIPSDFTVITSRKRSRMPGFLRQALSR
jgi:hypothetical protein